MSRDVVVLLSGGLDSTTLATIALKNMVLHSVISFRYGQPNTIAEMFAADAWATQHGIKREVLTVELAGVRSAMSVGVGAAGSRVLPGRNLAFLSLAVNYAAAQGCREVWFGATASDADGYPDCRHEFVASVDALCRAAYGVSVKAPLAHHNKVDVVRLALNLDVDIGATWSCYEPNPSTLMPCGSCNACGQRISAITDVELVREIHGRIW